MNETIKQFLIHNATHLTVALITAFFTLFATYVGFRLFEQSTTFQLQAMQHDITKLQDNAVQREELKPINDKLDDIKKDVSQIVDVLIKR